MVVGLVVIAACGLLLLSDQVRSALSGTSAQNDNAFYATEIVKKERFEISVTERGQVDSYQNSTLTNTVEGSTTIITIVPEGTMVKQPRRSNVAGVVRVSDSDSIGQCSVSVVAPIAVPFGVFAPIFSTGLEFEYQETELSETEVDDKVYVMTQVTVSDGEFVKVQDILIGDVVCELDSSALVDKEKTQQIQVTQASAALQKSRKSVEIQHAQNESDIAASRLAMDLARLALAKYEEGEYVKELETIQGNIKTLQADLAALEDEYAFYKRTADKGYTPLAQLEKQRIGVKQKRILLSVEKKALRLLADYDHEYNLKEKNEAASETVRELQRVRLSGEAALQQFFADVKACELTFTVEDSNLERLRRQIDGCRLIAPQAGEVVYANQQSRRSEPVVIEQGVVVRERQAVIKLPDLSKMKVDARIHESKISQVRKGQEVRIRVDAFPDILFIGQIDSVSSIPLPGNWPNTDLKEYEAEVRITTDEELVRKLKPGLTAGLEIIVAPTRESVLVIPVQAVLSVGTKYYAYVAGDKGPDQREILVGASNDQKIEILDGVQEGEKVIMNPRTHFSDQLEQLAQLESNVQAAAQENRSPGKGGPGAGGSGNAGSGKGRPNSGGQAARGKSAAGKHGGNSSAAGQRRAAAGGGFDPDAIFKRLDKDTDGKITLAEAPEQWQAGFPGMDGNGDGGITLEEWKQAISKRSGGGGPPR
ncbi:MAG: efflux RND transporter periplasmic adaptor subunit [Planctomycetaceae bacterium]